mmetsp:Transcript_25098/g.58260  ORF Transcript_25098/g.58260 Transcript_25098/m.58260 type:complete len:223 (+) Transcript_25098:456-1124(+)
MSLSMLMHALRRIAMSATLFARRKSRSACWSALNIASALSFCCLYSWINCLASLASGVFGSSTSTASLGSRSKGPGMSPNKPATAWAGTEGAATAATPKAADNSCLRSMSWEFSALRGTEERRLDLAAATATAAAAKHPPAPAARQDEAPSAAGCICPVTAAPDDSARGPDAPCCVLATVKLEGAKPQKATAPKLNAATGRGTDRTIVDARCKLVVCKLLRC